jgi:hypothetical protein
MMPAPAYAKRYSATATSPCLNRAPRSLFEARVARFVTRLLDRQRANAMRQLSPPVGGTTLDQRNNGAAVSGDRSSPRQCVVRLSRLVCLDAA